MVFNQERNASSFIGLRPKIKTIWSRLGVKYWLFANDSAKNVYIGSRGSFMELHVTQHKISSRLAYGFFLCCFQQLEAIQRSIEPLQDGILKLKVLAAATTNEGTLRDLNASLGDLRKAEKELRDRLFVIQIAKKYDWEAANKMARRKAGEFEDPDLAKVLEDREKKEEKAKKEKAGLAMSFKNKRGGRPYGGFQSFCGGYHGNGLGQTMTQHFPQEFGAARRGFGYQSSGFRLGRRGPNEDQRCHSCNQVGHFWQQCPNKK